MPEQREDLAELFDHVWDRFWRRMDGLDDEEWRWTPTADPRISLRCRLGLSAILFTLGGGGPRRVLREHWRTALAFALAGNAVYYLLLVIGVRAAGAPLTDMVIGAIPVVVAVTGNVLAPAGDGVSWRRLALPLALVTAGLALVSALEIAGVHAYLAASPAQKTAGLLAACG